MNARTLCEAGDWKLWPERWSGASSHGDVGDVVGAFAHVQRPTQRQTLVETSPTQQKRHQHQPRRARCTSAQRLRGAGTAPILYILLILDVYISVYMGGAPIGAGGGVISPHFYTSWRSGGYINSWQLINNTRPTCHQCAQFCRNWSNSLRYHVFSFQDGGLRHLGFHKFSNFISWGVREGRVASLC